MDAGTIKSAIIRGKFSNAELDEIANAVRFARSEIVHKNVGTMVLGTSVQFYHPKQHKHIQGRVTKVGRKFIKVDAGGLVWRVPANMLERI